jgi:hypothetical protein
VWLLCALCASARAATYYIDVTNGNNSWTGTSPTYVSGTTGPLLNFQNFRYGASPSIALNPGDLVLALPGVLDDTSDNIDYTLDPAYSGTSGSPIVFSNYDGAYFVISNSGANQNTINLHGLSWVNVFNINSTNAYRGPILQNCTNCQIAYCASGGTNSLGVLASWTFQNNVQYCWIHNNYGSSQPFNNSCGDGGDHGASLGTYDSKSDFTAFNIIESNTFTIGGHDCLSVYGPSNVIQNNWLFSPPSYYFTGCTPTTNPGGGVIYVPVYWGGRTVEIGGYGGNYNLFQSNDVDYAGFVPDEPGAVTVSDGKYNIIRGNRIACAMGNSIQLYGQKEGGDPCIGNVIYNNSAGYGGYNTTFIVSSGNPTNISYPVWQTIMGFAGGSNACIVNNLFYWNFNDNIAVFDSLPEIARWANNITNVNPLWMNTNTTENVLTLHPSLTPPDFHIPKESPAAGAGTWLAHITSASATSATFTVDNAAYFFAGLTANARTIPGDTIQFQGTSTTAVITAISGKTITVASSLTFSNGQGIALPYLNTAPSVGAYDVSQVTLAVGQSEPQPVQGVLWIGTNNPQSVVSGPTSP